MYGDKIRQRRQEKNLTLREFAKMTDIDFGALSKIENGLKQASIPQIRVIARVLGCSLDELFE